MARAELPFIALTVTNGLADGTVEVDDHEVVVALVLKLATEVLGEVVFVFVRIESYAFDLRADEVCCEEVVDAVALLLLQAIGSSVGPRILSAFSVVDDVNSYRMEFTVSVRELIRVATWWWVKWRHCLNVVLVEEVGIV